MLYKVFLVEDEIVTREGIRDNVDWKTSGFEFCGEAPDGEIALPLIEATQPDVLITDIKMPFMDGLQLCKIVREHLPWIKVVILSGHDEFNFAQSAIKLGVTEYLLKPVSVKDLHQVLQRTAQTLDKEKLERENLKRLREQVNNNLGLLREKFLLHLILGGITSVEAIEQANQLGLNLIANYHLVVVIRIGLPEGYPPFDYQIFQRVERLVSSLVENNPDVLLAQIDLEEIILLVRGNQTQQIVQEGTELAELIRQEVEEKTPYTLTVGLGSPQQRLGDIHLSFLQALARARGAVEESPPQEAKDQNETIDSIRLDQAALEHYLKTGTVQELDEFYNTNLQPIVEAAQRSRLVKHYIYLEILLTSAKFISDLHGTVSQVLPEMQQVERLIANLGTADQIENEIRSMLTATLTFRDSQVENHQAVRIHQARIYMDEHFSDPDLSLNQVASQVNLSPSHFSALFSHTMGETYRNYLTRLRVERAKELLRTTHLLCSEIAYQCGYNDPHYFSYIFKKNTGVSPQKFRIQPTDRKK
jgi:two-component system response regulator YesN